MEPTRGLMARWIQGFAVVIIEVSASARREVLVISIEKGNPYLPQPRSIFWVISRFPWKESFPLASARRSLLGFSTCEASFSLSYR